MKVIGPTFLILILASVASAQERSTLHPTDTLLLKRLVFPDAENSLGNLSILPTLRPSDVEINPDFPTSSLGIALLSGYSAPDKSSDLSWHMTLSQNRRDPLETLRMILGSVGEGGAAYLAYRHLSKYGFLK